MTFEVPIQPKDSMREVEASKSADSAVDSFCDRGRRDLIMYQSHFFDCSHPKYLSTLGLKIQEISDVNYY